MNDREGGLWRPEGGSIVYDEVRKLRINMHLVFSYSRERLSTELFNVASNVPHCFSVHKSLSTFSDLFLHDPVKHVVIQDISCLISSSRLSR